MRANLASVNITEATELKANGSLGAMTNTIKKSFHDTCH